MKLIFFSVLKLTQIQVRIYHSVFAHAFSGNKSLYQNITSSEVTKSCFCQKALCLDLFYGQTRNKCHIQHAFLEQSTYELSVDCVLESLLLSLSDQIHLMICTCLYLPRINN